MGPVSGVYCVFSRFCTAKVLGYSVTTRVGHGNCTGRGVHTSYTRPGDGSSLHHLKVGHVLPSRGKHSDVLGNVSRVDKCGLVISAGYGGACTRLYDCICSRGGDMGKREVPVSAGGRTLSTLQCTFGSMRFFGPGSPGVERELAPRRHCGQDRNIGTNSFSNK